MVAGLCERKVIIMIETSTGSRIKFTKIDEWVIKMTVSKRNKVVASPKFTIDQLREEITILEQTPPTIDRMDGREFHNG